MFSIIKRNKQSFVVAAVAATVLGGGAYAAIPAGDGTITACYDPNNPNLRVLDTAQTTACPAGQQKINWNQKGQRGPTGPMGAKGEPGPAYFVRVGANDNDVNRSTSRTTIRTWNFGDLVWVHTPSLDVTKCAVTATPISSAPNAVVTRAAMDYKDWIGLYTNVNGTRTRMAVDVTIACPETF